LSNAHDSTVRTWDVRPFAPADRRIMTFDGAPTGQERNLLKASWDSKGEKIAAGSGDQSVAIWESRTGKLLNKLPGHRGAVNDVRFHPLGEPLCKSRKFSLVRAMTCPTFVVRRPLRHGKPRKSKRLSRIRSSEPATSPSFSKTLRKPRLKRVYLR
jgi:WD40 repeat protein